jgi:hypothetical protein
MRAFGCGGGQGRRWSNREGGFLAGDDLPLLASWAQDQAGNKQAHTNNQRAAASDVIRTDCPIFIFFPFLNKIL